MNEEEKKAIEWLKNQIEGCSSLIQHVSYIENKKEYARDRTWFKLVLNLIENLQFTVECRDRVHEYDVKMIDEVKGECVKQCKIIREMAEMLVKDHEWFFSEFDDYTAEDFIEYFTKKVEEDK